MKSIVQYINEERNKFDEKDEVIVTKKDGSKIEGVISDWDYSFVTFKPTYAVDYKVDGKIKTMIGVPEESITLKKKGNKKDRK